MNKESELWIIKKTDFFPGEEFHENLYIGFKEDTFDIYKKIIKNLKNQNYKLEEIKISKMKGFKIDTSFISLEPIKNKKIDKIIEELTGNL